MRISVLLAVVALLALAPSASAASPSSDSRSAWTQVAPRAATKQAAVAPERYAALRLDQDALEKVLRAAPRMTISVPAPEGGFERFAIAESPVMEPELAAAHPEIATYSARGIDDPSATARLDLTPLGFHASVRSASGAWYVDPRYSDRSQYVAYRRDALGEAPAFEEPISVFGPLAKAAGQAPAGGEPVTLRTYRLALISDQSYTDKIPGGATTAAKASLVNRLNQIYEQDLAIRLVLVAGNDNLNLDTAKAVNANGPCGQAACFTTQLLNAGCIGEMLDRTNAVAAKLMNGVDKYDLAHILLGTNGGGLAYLGAVGTEVKGGGCTGSPSPFGDQFAIDYVAHEIGHQFGADHTFYGNVNFCSGNLGARAARVEPGSGSSIMAYTGICDTDNLQAHSDPYFSQASIAQINASITDADDPQAPAQEVALNEFDTGESFRIKYGDNVSVAAMVRPGTYTAGGLQTVVRSVLPAGATATVRQQDVSPTGFLVRFGGTLANTTPLPLEIVPVAGVFASFTSAIAAPGLTQYGGQPALPGNRAPTVSLNVAPAYTIPTRTPFLLDASASDLDGDTVTYLWEQNDAGVSNTGATLRSNTKTTGPLFRVFGTPALITNPGSSPAQGFNTATGTGSRSFPDIDQVLAGNTNAASGACPAGNVDCFSEFLPTSDWTGDPASPRVMHFRVTARDNHPGSGGRDAADVALTVAPTAGPFRITTQATNSAVPTGSPLPVNWSVAGTDGNGINVSAVKISLSLDGGRTFTKVLAAATPNDGTEVVQIPRVSTLQGRLKIEAVGNVFYDASRGTLSIDAGSPVVVNAGPAVDFGAVPVGTAAAPATVTFTSDGFADAGAGALSVGGADAGAVSVVGDNCSHRTLPANSACTVTVVLTPSHAGAQAATLALASNDPASPARIALTGTGTATQPPGNGGGVGGGGTSPMITPAQLAGGLLATSNPFAVGSAGGLQFFTKTKSTKLGKPKASRLLGAAVCVTGPCSGKATAKLTLTPRKGKKRNYTFNLAKSLKLATGAATKLTLKLRKADRKRIDAARKASLTLTLTSGTKRVTRTFTLTT